MTRSDSILELIRSDWLRSALRMDETTVFILPVLLFMSAFFLLPMALVVWLSLTGDEGPLSTYLYVLDRPVYVDVILGTLSISLYVVVICLVIGYPLAYCMTRIPDRFLLLAFALLTLPWWTSILVRSYAWVVILSPTGVVNSVFTGLGLIDRPLSILYNKFAVVVATAHVLFPFAVLPMYAVMRRFDRRLTLAAESLGAPPLRTFLHIYLPLTLPGVVAGATLVFIQALGFFITPALVGGGRAVVLSMLIESQVVELLNWALASALAVILLVLTILALGFCHKLVGLDRLSGGQQ